jgi:hypothetical protein
MKIKVYPLVSSLHNQNVVDNSTKGFLSALETKLNCSIEIERDVDKLYDNSDLSLLLIQTGGSENYFLRDKSINF